MACSNKFASGTTTHLYIFFDESGDLNFAKAGSPYYIFTALWTYHPACIATELINLRYGMLHHGINIQQFHAMNDPAPRRNMVFDALKGHTCVKAASIVVRKCRTHPSIRAAWDFYPQFFDYLVKFILKGDTRHGYQSVLLFADRPPTHKIGVAVAKALQMKAHAYIPANAAYCLYQHASVSHSGLQAADYCSWAVQRMWTAGQANFYAMLAHWYDKPPLDVFATGTTDYY